MPGMESQIIRKLQEVHNGLKGKQDRLATVNRLINSKEKRGREVRPSLLGERDDLVREIAELVKQ